MRIFLLSIFIVTLLSGCVTAPYYGMPVIENPNGTKVCGVHGTELAAREGYIFNGFMSGTEEFEFAARRYPNVTGPNFSPEYNEKFNQTLSHTAYVCEDCNRAHDDLKSVPLSVKRSATKKAQRQRARELDEAAELSQKTGNTTDAKVRDGDGWTTHVRTETAANKAE
jgi:hypothetical protein